MSSVGASRPLAEREVVMSNSSSPEPRFASLPASAPESRPAPRAWTGVLSLALHALLVAVVLVLPLLYDDRLPERVSEVHAFFAGPMELAPPPPPPPPPAASHVAAQAPRPAPTTAAFVAPVEVPTQIVPEEGLDLGVQGGMPGGVEGGVPGGVVGGLVGGLPDAPPAPPAHPLRAGLDVREPRKVKDVKPVYPNLAVMSRVQGVVVLDCQIDPRGRVVDVKVLRGNVVLNEAAVEAVRQWVYTPTLVNGVPVSVTMTVTLTFQLTEAR
jgi:protein TonB